MMNRQGAPGNSLRLTAYLTVISVSRAYFALEAVVEFFGVWLKGQPTLPSGGFFPFVPFSVARKAAKVVFTNFLKAFSEFLIAVKAMGSLPLFAPLKVAFITAKGVVVGDNFTCRPFKPFTALLAGNRNHSLKELAGTLVGAKVVFTPFDFIVHSFKWPTAMIAVKRQGSFCRDFNPMGILAIPRTEIRAIALCLECVLRELIIAISTLNNGWHGIPKNKTPLQIARSYHATGNAEVLVSKYSLFSFSDNNPSRDKGNYTSVQEKVLFCLV